MVRDPSGIQDRCLLPDGASSATLHGIVMKLYPVNGVILVVGCAVGFILGRHHESLPQADWDMAFELEAPPGFDWEKTVGEDVSFKFRTYDTRGGGKVLEGPSGKWNPGTREMDLEIYHRGKPTGSVSMHPSR